MALAERFDGAFNHRRKIATETVGHGGCAEIAAVIERPNVRRRSRQELGLRYLWAYRWDEVSGIELQNHV
jgi:hypothetical protein